MHLRNDIASVDGELVARVGTQRRVQDRPVLGDVDVLTVEHGFDPLPQARSLCKANQEINRRLVDEMLRQVGDQFAHLRR